MIQNLLLHQWGIWFTYQGEPNEYGDNLELIMSLKTPEDLAYLWKESPIAFLSKFFTQPELKQNAYLIKDKWKKVNSILVFKEGITPKWEDPANANGGRFIFQVPSSFEKKKDLYQGFLFYFLGEDFEKCESVNGLRFISSKNQNQSCFRVEVWASFNDGDEEMLKYYQGLFTNLFKQLDFKTVINFSNNNTTPNAKKNDKDPKPTE